MLMDVIILSWAKDGELQAYTEKAVNTLHDSEAGGVEFNCIVMETEKSLESFRYPHSKTLYPKEKFHYNRWCNLAFKLGQAPFVAFCNNDLEFTKGWGENIIKTMNDYHLNSASPYSIETFGQPKGDSVIKGFAPGKIVCGWCIIVRRNWFSKIMFDEAVEFYCSDNIYCEQLKKLSEPHGLVLNSIVNHAKNHPSVEKLDEAQKEHLCKNQVKKFNAMYEQNIFGWGT